MGVVFAMNRLAFGCSWILGMNLLYSGSRVSLFDLAFLDESTFCYGN